MTLQRKKLRNTHKESTAGDILHKIQRLGSVENINISGAIYSDTKLGPDIRVQAMADQGPSTFTLQQPEQATRTFVIDYIQLY